MSEVIQYTTCGLAVLGILAFLVSVIVQTIKELPYLEKLPTSAVALIISLILCPTALLAMCAWLKMEVTWYFIFASFLAAFPVHQVSTNGWEKLRDIWMRTKYIDSEGR